MRDAEEILIKIEKNVQVAAGKKKPHIYSAAFGP